MIRRALRCTRHDTLFPARTLSLSLIDGPRCSTPLTAGRTPVAGVAWAPGTGISAVEVQVDDGPWRPATLGASAGPTTWVQWVLDWDAEPGQHTLRVRATDATGLTPPEERTNPAPNGAAGPHTVKVSVRAEACRPQPPPPATKRARDTRGPGAPGG